MIEGQITVKESARELVKSIILVATTFILLNSILGFVVEKFYMNRSIALPAITQFLIELRFALGFNIFFIIPIIIVILSILLLIEIYIIKNHTQTYVIFKNMTFFLIILNILITIAILLPIIR